MTAKCCRNIIYKTQESYNGHKQAMIEELDELERLAKIGKAIEKAYSKGAILIYDIEENNIGSVIQYNYDETIDDILMWLESEE